MTPQRHRRVQEDVIEILLNLKVWRSRCTAVIMMTLTLSKKGPGQVTAADYSSWITMSKSSNP